MPDARLTVLLDGLHFPEAPRWRDGRLYLSDFYAHRVLSVGPDGKARTEVEVPQQPSGIGWMPDGAMLVVSMLDRCLMKWDGARLSRHADLSAIATGPCNDMVVDAAGRAYVGNFGYDRHKGEAQRTTALARIDPDGTVSVAAEDLLFPNGAVIAAEGRTLIVAETFAHRLTAFAIGADGALSGRRVFAALDGVYPDGICLDAEGAVWVADPRGNRCLRVFDGGRIAEEVSTGDRGAYACMLGGDDRRTLFVLTNSGSGPAARERTDGRVETLRVGVPGAGLP